MFSIIKDMKKIYCVICGIENLKNLKYCMNIAEKTFFLLLEVDEGMKVKNCLNNKNQLRY